jgi:hypothetical protein
MGKLYILMVNYSNLKVLSNNPYNFLVDFADCTLPRILTQVCRDPNSQSYGCADRNWWHYKIRDFPSIILQQVGATLWAARDHKVFLEQHAFVHDIAVAACLFWNKRAIKFHAFEEYYPWEEGYPPLAFSTLSIARLVGENVVDVEEVKDGLKIATQQLSSRFEEKAGNQQVAGFAALSWIRKILPGEVSDELWESMLVKTLKLQDSEGWYQEYGGPDLGYLSVTIDCLWDAYDASNDERLLASAVKAFEFVEKMISVSSGKGIGMHNSRNTDYIVPYGISRLVVACGNPDINLRAKQLLQNIFFINNKSDHFLFAVDDRYLCHYVGLSVMRSIQCLATVDMGSIVTGNVSREKVEKTYLPSCGYISTTSNDERIAVLISVKKGGNLTAYSQVRTVSDFGWIVFSGSKQLVSHWWSDEWVYDTGGCDKSESCWVISGHFVEHNEMESTPFRHFVLRFGSLFLGRRLIPILKSILILKKRKSEIGFRRKILVNNNVITIYDHILGVSSNSKIIRAPRSSKRHVASADGFHYEDLSMGHGENIEEVRENRSNSIMIKTSYSFP